MIIPSGPLKVLVAVKPPADRRILSRHHVIRREFQMNTPRPNTFGEGDSEEGRDLGSNVREVRT